MSQPAQSSAQTTASQPAQSLLPESTGLFTTANFVLIAVLALIVVLGLIHGARQRRRRREARGELTAHNDALRAEGVTETPVDPSREPTVVTETPAPPLPFRGGAGGGASPPATLLEATPHASPSDEGKMLEDGPSLADEPIAAAAPTAAGNLAAEAAPPAPAGPSPADGPVTQLKGLGPRVAERLAAHGITTVGQLAALTDDDATALDAQLGPFTGRMTRDRWLEQARFLAAGDRAGFEAVFGRL